MRLTDQRTGLLWHENKAVHSKQNPHALHMLTACSVVFVVNRTTLTSVSAILRYIVRSHKNTLYGSDPASTSVVSASSHSAYDRGDRQRKKTIYNHQEFSLH